MLGALILQVMDKSEIESLKVMIFLVEGILPPGYFSGSLGGLQVDMAVFRDLLGGRLPRLARHLQKLQGPLGEGNFTQIFDTILSISNKIYQRMIIINNKQTNKKSDIIIHI